MSIYTNLSHKLKPEEYRLVVQEICKWADEQAKDYADSQFVYTVASDAYRQALQHLKHSLTAKEEQL